MMEIATYILIILTGVLPALVPMLAFTLPLQAGWLATRGKWVMAALCLAIAGYCAALAFGPVDGVPGGQAFHALRKAEDRRDLGKRIMQSSAFGGTGKPVTVGEVMDVYGESTASQLTAASRYGQQTTDSPTAAEAKATGDEPMVDPTPTM